MSKLGYKIISFDEITASILVQPDNGFPSINIQLPIIQGKFPIGKELDDYIQGFLPYHEVKRAEEVANAKDQLNVEDIKSMLQPEKAPKIIPEFSLNNHYLQISDKLFKKNVNEVSAKYPEVSYDIVSQITSKYWRGLTVEAFIRESDSKLIGVLVTSMTGVLGSAILLELRDLQKSCANIGIPLFGFVVASVVSKDELTRFMGTFGGKSISGPQSNFVYDEYNLSMAKNYKHKLISQDRDNELAKGFEFGGLRFVCDSLNTSNLIEAIETARLISLPNDFKWRSISGVELIVNIKDLEAMLKSSQSYKYNVLRKSWNRKLQLEDATSIEQVNKI